MDNLLIQEFYPLLQVFSDVNHPEYAIDNLRLFSKKLQTYDVNLLADAYLELEEINPKLATDILKFSVLQSGFSYSPIAFLQVLPANKVLEFTSEYFSLDIINNLDLHNVYREFIRNNATNPRIIPTQELHNKQDKQAFKSGTIFENTISDYIAKRVKISSSKRGIKTESQYFTKVFEYAENEAEFGREFKEMSKRGILTKLLEISTVDSIIKINKSKYGLKTLKLNPKTVERVTTTDSTYIINSEDALGGREFLLPNGAHVKLISAGKFNENAFLSNSSIKENFGITTAGKIALEELAQLNGYKNYNSFRKSTKFANKLLRFYEVAVITDGYTIQDDLSVDESTKIDLFDPDSFNPVNPLPTATLKKEVDTELEEGRCKKKRK